MEEVIKTIEAFISVFLIAGIGIHQIIKILAIKEQDKDLFGKIICPHKTYEFWEFKSKESILIHIVWFTPIYDLIMIIYGIYYFIFKYIPKSMKHYINLPDTEKDTS